MNKSCKRKQKQKQPIYFVVRKVVDPSTGELIGALVPLTEWDVRAMRDRKYKVGTEVRAIMTKPRNGWMLRVTHLIGKIAIDHIEGFEMMATHDAVKKLQTDSGVCCDISSVEIDLTSLGIGIVKAPVKQAQSMAYDEMEDADFDKLALGICAYIRDKFAGVPPEELEKVIEKVEQGAS